MIARILPFCACRLPAQNKKRLISEDLSQPSFDTSSLLDYVSSKHEQPLDKLMAAVDRNLKREGEAIQMRIKQAMRRYRTERNLTQRDMANFLGLSTNNYASYETRPVRNVPPEVIARFCTYTLTDLNWIMRGIPPAVPMYISGH